MDTPHTYICPITKDIMKDPVLAADGFSYEREAIAKWFSLGRKTSPVTNLALECTQVFPNRGLKSSTEEFVRRERQRLKKTLLATLGTVRTNAADKDPTNEALLACAFVGGAAPSYDDEVVIDTLCIVHSILKQWNEDADVCAVSLTALIHMMDVAPSEERLQQVDFFTLVMDMLRRFDSSASLLSLCLQYIWRYSRSDGFLKAASIHKFKVCDLVVGAMKQHVLDKEVQMHGFRAIEMLGMNFPSTIFKSGVPKVLVTGATNFTDDAHVVVSLCGAIQRLTAGMCARLCHSGICGKLADAMTLFPHDMQLQRSCCLVLGKLCHAKSCDASVCDVVVASLRECCGVGDVACKAISRLAFWERNAARIGALGGTHLVLACLRNASFHELHVSQEHALHAMHALHMLVTWHDDENSIATKETGESLVKALELFGNHRKMAFYCIKTFHVICMSSVEFTNWCKGEWKTPFKVIRVMREHVGEEDIQEIGWSFLDMLALHRGPVEDLVMESLALETAMSC